MWSFCVFSQLSALLLKVLLEMVRYMDYTLPTFRYTNARKYSLTTIQARTYNNGDGRALKSILSVRMVLSVVIEGGWMLGLFFPNNRDGPFSSKSF